MKDYIQELAHSPLGTSDVTAITPKVIAAAIEEIRRAKRIWAQFYRPNRDLMGSGGREVDFPKKKSGIVASWDISPGTGLSASSMTYDATTIPIKKGGVGLGFQGEAIRQANRDVLADAIKEAGEVWADTLDLVAFEAMFPSVTTLAAAAATVAGSVYVLGISSQVGSATIAFRLNDGSIVFGAADTITYHYVPTTGVLSSDTVACRRYIGDTSGGTFRGKDLLRARADIIAKNHYPNVAVIHPNVLTDILYDNTIKFLERSAYAANTPTELYNGELGRIWDIRVVVTTKMPRYGMAVIATGDLGYEIHRKPLNLVRDEYSGMSADVLYFWGFQEINYGVVNPHAYGAVCSYGSSGTISDMQVDKFGA